MIKVVFLFLFLVLLTFGVQAYDLSYEPPKPWEVQQREEFMRKMRRMRHRLQTL